MPRIHLEDAQLPLARRGMRPSGPLRAHFALGNQRAGKLDQVGVHGLRGLHNLNAYNAP